MESERMHGTIANDERVMLTSGHHWKLRAQRPVSERLSRKIAVSARDLQQAFASRLF
jgi:hypothetical protein